MNNLVLGLDIGVTSVGWGVVEKETGKIVDAGVRLFEEATSKENADRRSFRSSRRLKRRKAFRIHRIESLLKVNGFLSKDYKPSKYNPYECRKKGLTEKLTNDELVCALIHIAKLRGSSLEVATDENDKNEGVLKEVLKKNTALVSGEKYICEIQLERLKNEGKIRGHQNLFKTKDYVKELKQILSNQNLGEELNNKIIEIVSKRRHFSEGPGGENSPTPYGRYTAFGAEKIDLIAKMRGNCSVFKDQLRAPIHSYTYSLYNLYNDLNNLNIENRKMTSEEKEEVLNKCVRANKKVTLKEIAKICNAAESEISGYRIDKSDKPIFTEFKGLNAIVKKVKGIDTDISWNTDIQVIDKIVDVLIETKIIEERIERLSTLIGEEAAIQVSNITTISQYGRLSYKALNLFINEMKDSSDNQMVISERLNLSKEYGEYLKDRRNIPFEANDVTNPVVVRAQREAIKVINKIREQYGELEAIVIEMAREKNSDDEKKILRDIQKRNELINKRIEGFVQPEVKISLKTRTKLRLAIDQDWKCAYSKDKIDLEVLLTDDNAYEIDHILPISLSYDDSYENKVLVTRAENQKKGQRTPFEYFSSGKAKITYSEFKEFVKNNKNFNKKKRDNLLYEGSLLDTDTQGKFINRNLQDTRYACRNILNLIKQYFKYNNIDTKTFVLRGSFTNQFRKKANIKKEREEFKHHAIDALILAQIRNDQLLASKLDGTFKNKNYYLKDNTIIDSLTGEVIHDSLFNEKTLYKISLIKQYDKANLVNKFSWKVDRKPNRSVSDQTIYSTRLVEGKQMLVKKWKNIYGDDGKKLKDAIIKGEEDKILLSKHDPKTFEIIKKIVQEYPNEENPFAKFKEEHGFLRKYSKKGNGPIIESIKYLDGNLGNHIDISKNYDVKDKKVVLLQISPFRMDLYLDKGVYKFVTIRYPHVKKVKNEYIIDSLVYSDLLKSKNISNAAEFVYSFYRNDLIELIKENSVEIYKFIAVNSDSNNRIEVKHINKTIEKRIKPIISNAIKKVNKYNTDVLGNLHIAPKETLKLKL